MTLLSSLDTGPGAARAPAANLPEMQGTTPGAAAQPFALLLATGQVEGLPATGSATLPTAEAATTEGEATTLPDILAQLLNPATGAAAPNAETPADVADLPLPDMPLPDLPTTPGASEGETPSDDIDLAVMADLPLPNGLPETSLAEPAPEAQDIAPPETEATEGAPDVPAPMPAALPLAAPVAASPTSVAKPDTARTPDATAKPLDAASPGRTVAAKAQAPIPPESAQTRPAPPEAKAAAPEVAPPPAEPVLPGTEAPRPVAVSISQAPTLTAPATAPATLPVLQMTRPDWPLDLADRLLEGASLRSLASGGLMEIRLDPDSLGPVTLRLEVTDGTANVAIVTQTPEAARLFTDNQQRLADALARAGLDLGQHSAGTDARGGQSHRDRPEGRGQGAGPAAPPHTDAPPRETLRARRVDLIA